MKYILLLLIFILLGLSGCLKDPIHTRDSQEPAGSSGTWETPAVPEVVISNLMFAYNEKNIQNYQLCFGQNFLFSSPEDSIEAEAQGFGYLYYLWDWNMEIIVTENIFSSFTEEGSSLDLILSFSNDYPDSIGDTLAVIYRDYTLRVIQPDSIQSDTVIIEGTAAFHLSQPSYNLWSIYLWEETITGRSGDSWANFKAEYRNR